MSSSDKTGWDQNWNFINNRTWIQETYSTILPRSKMLWRIKKFTDRVILLFIVSSSKKPANDARWQLSWKHRIRKQEGSWICTTSVMTSSKMCVYFALQLQGGRQGWIAAHAALPVRQLGLFLTCSIPYWYGINMLKRIRRFIEDHHTLNGKNRTIRVE